MMTLDARHPQVCQRWHTLEHDHTPQLWRTYFQSRLNWREVAFPFYEDDEERKTLPQIPTVVNWKQECRQRFDSGIEWRKHSLQVSGTSLESTQTWTVNPELASPSLEEDLLSEGNTNYLRTVIANAKPYDRIEVSPGRYVGNLAIQIPIEIVGLGEVGSIRIVGCVAVMVQHVRLFNLSVESGGGSEAGNQPHAVLKIFDPDGAERVAAQGASNCVTRNDSGAERGRSHKKEEISTVQVEECTIRGTVEVRQCNVIFRRNEVRGSICVTGLKESQHNFSPALPEAREYPVMHPLRCNTVLERNYIHQAPEALITLETHCNASLKWNVINRGGDAGIRMSQGSKALIDSNSIMGNTGPGILVRDWAFPGIHRNRIMNGQHYGILMYQNGATILKRSRYGIKTKYWSNKVGFVDVFFVVCDSRRYILTKTFFLFSIALCFS